MRSDVSTVCSVSGRQVPGTGVEVCSSKEANWTVDKPEDPAASAGEEEPGEPPLQDERPQSLDGHPLTSTPMPGHLKTGCSCVGPRIADSEAVLLPSPRKGTPIPAVNDIHPRDLVAFVFHDTLTTFSMVSSGIRYYSMHRYSKGEKTEAMDVFPSLGFFIV